MPMNFEQPLDSAQAHDSSATTLAQLQSLFNGQLHCAAQRLIDSGLVHFIYDGMAVDGTAPNSEDPVIRRRERRRP